MERRLAAIHAADVACYNRLMEDEAGTRAALNELRQGIFVSLVAGHCGWIVKVMRDRALVEFASVVNMVDCAVDLQVRMAAANHGVAYDRRIVLRIRINLQGGRRRRPSLCRWGQHRSPIERWPNHAASGCPEDLDSGVMTQNLLRHSPDVERANPNSVRPSRGCEALRRKIGRGRGGRAGGDGFDIRTRARARIAA
jgi:hypothetical protein